MSNSRSHLLTVISTAFGLSLLVGCVNLDKRDPSPFRFGQKTKNGQTVATNGGAKKSIAKMQNATKSTGFTNKVKEAWPFKHKVRQTVEAQPLAKDDPTRLDYLPANVGPDLYVAAARMSEQSGNYQQAFEQYNTALKSDADNRNALIGLARLEHRVGKTDAAIQTYRRALATHQNDAVIMNDLGICYARKKQLSESIGMLQAATKAAPDREMYVNNLAASLIEANRMEEALAHLSRIRPPAVANYNVGYLLGKTGRTDEATAYLHQALAMDPNLRQARELLNDYAPQVSSLPAAAP